MGPTRLVVAVIAILLGQWPALSTATDRPFSEYLWRVWSTEAGLPQVSVVDMIQDHDGLMWLATQSGLAEFDGARFRVFDRTNTPAMTHMMLHRLHNDPLGRILVATSGNLLRMEGGEFVELTRAGASVGGIRAFAQSPQGQVYAGGPGLFRVDGRELVAVSVHTGTVHSLLMVGDTLWVGGTDGLGELTRDGYRWHPFPETGSTVRIAQLESWHGAIWAGTDQGLFRLASGTWQRIGLHEDAQVGQVESLYADREGNLWVGTQAALIRMYDGVVRERLDTDSGWPFGLVMSMLTDRDGYLWLGTQIHGVARLRAPLTRRIGTDAGLPDALVWAYLPWGDGVLVGTNRGVASLVGGRATVFIDAAWLPNPVAYSLHLDASSDLWVGTRAGLAQFDTRTRNRIRDFPELAHLQVNAITQSSDGVIWAGTSGGLFRNEGHRFIPAEAESPLGTVSVRYLYEHVDGRLWVGTESGMFTRTLDGFVRIDEPSLARDFITFIGRLDDDTMVVGTFDQGFALAQGDGWRWTRPDDGLPTTSVMFVAQVRDRLLISSLQGLYSIPLAFAYGDRNVGATMLIDERGGESRTDIHRCCNGAGNGKGLVHAGSAWLPTLNGAVSMPLSRIDHALPPPRPIIEFTGSSRGPRDLLFAFTAPMYARIGSLRFRYRLIGYDQGWVDAGSRREAAYTNLAHGNYTFQVATTVDGDHAWSETVSRPVRIPPYWYETVSARVLIIIGVLSVLFGAFKAFALMVARRQRLLEHLVSERTRELDEANRKLEQASLTDPLTGLHNRRYFDRMLPQIQARARRAANAPVCLLLDLDHFKQVNDRYGHAMGDLVLQEIARWLQRQLRATDHMVRWGGEEFLVVQENSTAPEEVAARLARSIVEHNWSGMGLQAPITCSIGAAVHPLKREPAWTWDSTLILADKALYLMKGAGRRGWIQLSVADDAPADLAARLPEIAPETLLDSGWVRAASSVATLVR